MIDGPSGNSSSALILVIVLFFGMDLPLLLMALGTARSTIRDPAPCSGRVAR